MKLKSFLAKIKGFMFGGRMRKSMNSTVLVNTLFLRENLWPVLCFGAVYAIYDGVGTLITVNRNMDIDKYTEVLDQNLWPFVAQHFLNQPWILQEDNAPCHVSQAANAWKIENNIPTLPWPVQSPGLNIIRQVWMRLKLLVEKRLDKIESKTTKTSWKSPWVPSHQSIYAHCMTVFPRY